MRLSLVLILLLLCPAVAFGAAAVYPLKGVLGFSEPTLETKAPAFAGWIREEGVPKIAAHFQEEFRRQFGTAVVDDVDEANKHRVLVASLHLVRASQYAVPKRVSGCTEYLLPITLSLVFTNPATGDVIYSFTDTSNAPAEISDQEAPEYAARLLRDVNGKNYHSLVGQLIAKARQGYNPSQIETSVVEIWKGLYILDKGSKFGIARDDSLVDAQGNEIQVNYATEDYAVAVPLLVSKVGKGQKFSKLASQSTVKTLKKPKVLTMHRGWQDEQLTAISHFFDSEISKESAFTLLPVNEGFSALLAMLARDTHIGQQVTNQRPLPDYFIKFGYTEPRVYEVSQPGKFGFNVYEQYVLGELLDKQGRIIFSAVAGDRIEDKNVDGMVLNRESRQEILLKNAVKGLAEQFSRSIKFSQFRMPVAGTSGSTIDIKDQPRQLRPGDSIQIFRNVGEVSGIAGDVLVPIWLAEVREANAGAVRAELVLPVSNEVKDIRVSSKDLVLVNAISAKSGGESGTSVTYCTGASAKLGSLELVDFSVLSRGFGYLLPYSLYDADGSFIEKVANAVKVGGFSSSTLRLGKVNTAGRCLQPVYKAALEETTCEEGACDATVGLAVGYRLYMGKEKKGGAASETKLSIRKAREDVLVRVIQDEVDKSSLSLLRDNIVKVLYR